MKSLDHLTMHCALQGIGLSAVQPAIMRSIPVLKRSSRELATATCHIIHLINLHMIPPLVHTVSFTIPKPINAY